METLKLRLTGVAPLLMHNGRLADQLDEVTKQLKSASKNAAKGTDSGQERIARLEYAGSLYMRSDGSLYFPAAAIERALRDGSVGVQKGMKKGFAAAVIVNEDAEFKFKGKQGKTEDELYDAGHLLRVGVKVTTSRIMRTRPMFKDWSASVVVEYVPTIVNRAAVLAAAEYAGQVVGIGDWRPRFGRFTVEEVK